MGAMKNNIMQKQIIAKWAKDCPMSRIVFGPSDLLPPAHAARVSLPASYTEGDLKWITRKQLDAFGPLKATQPLKYGNCEVIGYDARTISRYVSKPKDGKVTVFFWDAHYGQGFHASRAGLKYIEPAFLA